MKLRHSIALFTLFVLAACSQEKRASELLSAARTAYEAGDYSEAKLLIDSLRNSCPKAPKAITEALYLFRQTEYEEHKRTAAYSDSVLRASLAEIEVLKKGFILVKDEAYESVGIWYPRGLTPEEIGNRPSIRCGVSEEGELILNSVYYGRTKLGHQGLKIVAPDGTYGETALVAPDGAFNYSFQNGGVVTEVVTYRKGTEQGATGFLANHQGVALKAELIGGRSFVFPIAPATIQGAFSCFQLAALMADCNELAKQRTLALSKMRAIEKRNHPKE